MLMEAESAVNPAGRKCCLNCLQKIIEDYRAVQTIKEGTRVNPEMLPKWLGLLAAPSDGHMLDFETSAHGIMPMPDSCTANHACINNKVQSNHKHL